MSNLSGIIFQASLPLEWQVDEYPSEALLATTRKSNLALLHALATLESASDKEHFSDLAVAKAVDRLEAKLDVMIGLFAKLLSQRANIPASTPVALSVRRITWQKNAIAPTVGTVVSMHLYLSPELAEPLRLYARLSETLNGRHVAEILDQDEEFEEWMTRTLFRYHRRQLQARHHP